MGRKCLHASFCMSYLCKTLLCILLLDACLENGKSLSHHKPYISLHCVFYTESPTESKSSDERGRYRSCKTKGRTDSFTHLSRVRCRSPRSNLERDGSLASDITRTTQLISFGQERGSPRQTDDFISSARQRLPALSGLLPAFHRAQVEFWPLLPAKTNCAILCLGNSPMDFVFPFWVEECVCLTK